jgi:hypothetical protein
VCVQQKTLQKGFFSFKTIAKSFLDFCHASPAVWNAIQNYMPSGSWLAMNLKFDMWLCTSIIITTSIQASCGEHEATFRPYGRMHHRPDLMQVLPGHYRVPQRMADRGIKPDSAVWSRPATNKPAQCAGLLAPTSSPPTEGPPGRTLQANFNLLGRAPARRFVRVTGLNFLQKGYQTFQDHSLRH